MARRTAPRLDPTEIDPDQIRIHFRRLARRLRLTHPLDGPEYTRTAVDIAAIETATDDPEERLARLLEMRKDHRPA